ncbi:hypothetical protein V2J09_022257 [Rumex salicifolius]
MGGSGNWLKSFISHKNSNPSDQVKVAGGKRSSKWKLWRTSSSSSIDSGLSVKRVQVAASQPSDSTTQAVNDVYSAAMATLIRAPPRNFLIVRKEWAAIRIQTAFRALLARRALRALKALVRLQAIVRGRLVRKQAAMTLKCMQALVRAQAQIKAHRVRISLQGKSLDNQLPPPKQPLEAGLRKEKAMANSVSQQATPKKQLRATLETNPWKKESFSGPIETHKLNSKSSTLHEWMVSEPRKDNILMEELAHLEFSPDSATSLSPLSSEEHIKKGKPRSKAIAKSRGEATIKRSRRRHRDVSYCSSSSSSVSSSTTVDGADDSATSSVGFDFGFGHSKSRLMNLAAERRKQQGIAKRGSL